MVGASDLPLGCLFFAELEPAALDFAGAAVLCFELAQPARLAQFFALQSAIQLHGADCFLPVGSSLGNRGLELAEPRFECVAPSSLNLAAKPAFVQCYHAARIPQKMGHFLNFGAGPNQLPEPWQNLGGADDIRKPLRFASGSVSRIHCEHVIEHASFSQGWHFLGDCLRVLEPGGVLRLSFPDPGRFIAATAADEMVWNERGDRYGELVAERVPSVRQARDQRRAAMTMLLGSWGHLSAWSAPVAAAALLACGFRFVYRRRYGEGFAGDADGHHKDVGREWATLETTIIEAEK